MGILLRWIIMTASVMIAAYLLPGVTVQGFWAALITALVLGLVNALLRPVLILLTLPLTVVTLGLFIFVVNGLLVLLAAWIVDGFHVAGLGWAILFSIVVSIVSFVFHQVFG